MRNAHDLTDYREQNTSAKEAILNYVLLAPLAVGFESTTILPRVESLCSSSCRSHSLLLVDFGSVCSLCLTTRQLHDQPGCRSNGSSSRANCLQAVAAREEIKDGFSACRIPGSSRVRLSKKQRYLHVFLVSLTITPV